ncbi:MAG: hypothetical protein GTO24_21150 [candidate division Zixibacteria bacterium]|nr:hypothetical protein [candidate division Zixibacteria bacterium]
MTIYTPIPSEAIRSDQLNERVFHTFCRIVERCWNPETGKFDWIEPNSMSQIAKIFDKPRSTLIEHFKALERDGWIMIHRLSSMVLTIKPAVSVGEPTELSASRPITINTPSLKESSLSMLKEKNVGQPTTVGQPTVNVEIVELLRSKGVGEPTRTKIASGNYSFSYILNWLKYNELKGDPVGYAIAAIRDDLPCPEFCKLCGGVDGDHKSVMDTDNALLMCPREDFPHLDGDEIYETFGELKRT